MAARFFCDRTSRLAAEARLVCGPPRSNSILFNSPMLCVAIFRAPYNFTGKVIILAAGPDRFGDTCGHFKEETPGQSSLKSAQKASSERLSVPCTLFSRVVVLHLASRVS